MVTEYLVHHGFLTITHLDVVWPFVHPFISSMHMDGIRISSIAYSSGCAPVVSQTADATSSTMVLAITKDTNKTYSGVGNISLPASACIHKVQADPKCYVIIFLKAILQGTAYAAGNTHEPHIYL